MWPCSHKETQTHIVEATCSEAGQKQDVCVKCSEVVNSEVLPELGHSFGEFTVKVLPIPNVNGVESRTCLTCGFEEEREYFCPHENPVLRTILEPTCSEVGINEATCPQCEFVQYLPIEKLPHAETKSVVFQAPTCSVEGIEHMVCVECEEIDVVNPIPLLECNWGEWEIDKYATPFAAGLQHHICQDCEREVSESYTIELKENYIYIPEADILCKFAVSSFTQGAVDNNDVVYTKRAYGVFDETNPFVLGHWFGSLNTLWHTPIGAKIYINIDGKIDIYEVINSEYAVETAGVYHLGQETGVNVWDTYGSAMNSKYAVFGRSHYGEDLWPEENNGATLHMYTCHNNKNKPGWKPEHGGRGRWIVLANLIDSIPLESDSSAEG